MNDTERDRARGGCDHILNSGYHKNVCSKCGARFHELKTWPEQFQAVAAGWKTHEYRLNDRDYQVNDILHLREWSPESECYTGDDLNVTVTYVGKDGFGIPDGYAVLSIALARQVDRNAMVEAERDRITEQIYEEVLLYASEHDLEPSQAVAMAVDRAYDFALSTRRVDRAEDKKAAVSILDIYPLHEVSINGNDEFGHQAPAGEDRAAFDYPCTLHGCDCKNHGGTN